jgi:hypothetical protein
MMELSTRFLGITTSTKAKNGGVSIDKAAAKAKANLRYIDRSTAVKKGHAVGEGLMKNLDGSLVQSSTEGRAAMYRAIDKRSGTGGKNGKRVAEKMMVSLPNDFAGKPSKEALRNIMKRLVADSDALAYGVIHTDRPDNLHCHILAVDGQESVASACKRKPDAKRVRRREQLRMNDRGRPREVRRMIAEEINAIAEVYGLTKVEHRSFKDRGITREPGAHLGPQQIARIEREARQKRIPAPSPNRKVNIRGAFQ